jgi:hypothetical protein
VKKLMASPRSESRAKSEPRASLNWVCSDSVEIQPATSVKSYAADFFLNLEMDSDRKSLISA